MKRADTEKNFYEEEEKIWTKNTRRREKKFFGPKTPKTSPLKQTDVVVAVRTIPGREFIIFSCKKRSRSKRAVTF